MEVNLDGPKEGEVLVEIKATGICHTMNLHCLVPIQRGLFPAILGHEGAGLLSKSAQGSRI